MGFVTFKLLHHKSAFFVGTVDFSMSAIRVGATTGIANRVLAKKNAKVVGIFGSGNEREQFPCLQAEKQNETPTALERRRKIHSFGSRNHALLHDSRTVARRHA
jgi:ornithine cyclodeaminase/alanine dehydrogenase-like protein (mu-crystallin family)